MSGMKHEIILVTGGVKSGKSSLALKMAEKQAESGAFIATATAGDEEMERKIAAHRQERGPGWCTYEEPRSLAARIEAAAARYDIVLVDCLTMWVSNLLTLYGLERNEVLDECARTVSALDRAPAPVILVTNETGMGIMPPDSLSRTFHDLLGKLNRDVAGIAASVIFMVSGIPLKIK